MRRKPWIWKHKPSTANLQQRQRGYLLQQWLKMFKLWQRGVHHLQKREEIGEVHFWPTWLASIDSDRLPGGFCVTKIPCKLQKDREREGGSPCLNPRVGVKLWSLFPFQIMDREELVTQCMISLTVIGGKPLFFKQDSKKSQLTLS